MSDKTATLGARIDAYLDHGARELVAAYFEKGSRFTGDLFDTLGENDPNIVARDDLLAVTLLDVRFSPRAVRYLLEDVAEQISDKLQRIDPAVRIWEDPERLLDGPATDLWRIIRGNAEIDGIGRTITGKLLARKRPHLVPIIDGVVEKVTGVNASDPDSWSQFREALSDADRRARLAALQPPNVAEVSVLRLLDVLLWMSGSQGQSAKLARRKLGLET